MDLYITELPLRKILKTAQSSFKSDDTVQDALDRIESTGIDTTGRKLIIDRSILLSAISSKDPVNQYYRGTIGDIYRIDDVNGVRYRRVAKGDMQQTQNKINSAPSQDVPGSYFKAYETLITMLTDRRCTLNSSNSSNSSNSLSSLRKKLSDMKQTVESNISQLNIKGLKDRNDRDVYVVFMAHDNYILTTRQKAGIISGNPVVVDIIKDIATKHNLEQFDIDDEAKLNAYAKYADIIIVYNNPTNEHVTIEKTHSGTFLQFFSVQQLSFNITKHRDQPTFYLLDPKADRKELVDIYSLNGIILDTDKKLSDYKITSDTKLILI